MTEGNGTAMYLGIDFLLAPDLRAFAVDVNVGLPGGAEEFDRAHLVRRGEPSGVFARIEETAWTVYGCSFRDYLHGLPFTSGLKQVKLWMDGLGALPEEIHPFLRLEDKWVQYGLLRGRVPVPETMAVEPLRPEPVLAFLAARGRAVLKRRVGRGGRGLALVADAGFLLDGEAALRHTLVQEYIPSRVDAYTLSIRTVAFGGRFLCAYANLSPRLTSNHGIITQVCPGGALGLADRSFRTRSFNRMSWEAGIWFGRDAPPQLRHNLYEDEVADTTLVLPEPVYEEIARRAVEIERLYEALDPGCLPRACFEGQGDG